MPAAPTSWQHRLRVRYVFVAFIACLAGCQSEGPNELGEQEQVIPGVEIATLKTGPQKKEISEPIKPACLPSLQEGQLFVDGTAINISVDSERDYQVFPFDPDHILVGKKHPWRIHNLDAPKGILWSVPCKAPQKTEIFYQRVESDFGNAALSSSGHVLFFTSKAGIQRLFLSTKTVEPVIDSPPVSELCWTHAEKEYPQSMVDIVLGLNRNKGLLSFERGSFCGLSATWISRMWQLSIENVNPEVPTIRSPHPFTTLTEDASGQLWAGDGARCNQPGVIDKQTPGFVFVSRNGGVDWEAIQIQYGQATAHTAARSIRADHDRPGHVVVHGVQCTNPLGTYGGLLYMTRDAGKSWRRIPVSMKAGDPSDGGTAVVDFDLISGSIDRLRVWNQKGETFETNNTGRKWVSVKKRPHPKLQDTVLTDIGRWRTSSDGLELKSGSKKAVFRFPSQPTESN